MLSDTTAPAEGLQDKLAALEQLLLAYGRVAIGFSGGVDSSFLAAVCARIMPASTLLVHLTTPLIGTPEQASFERSVDGQANEGPHFKLPVLNLSVDQLRLPQVACNDADRCYHCKRAGFTAIVNHARSLGFPTVIDGSNASDRGDYRPGMRAAQELGVRSPLMEVGFTKDEERELLRAWGYPVWNLPAGACLATRVPTGEELTREKVDVIRACEDYLHDLGLDQVRARLVGGCMHIEAAPADVAKIAALKDDGEVDADVFSKLKERFVGALNGDLNTSVAVTALYDVLKAKCNDATKLAAIADFDQVLSLNLLSAAKTLREKQAQEEQASADPEIDALVAARTEAKKAKNFAEADRIRDELKARGIEIIDTPQGAKWRKV